MLKLLENEEIKTPGGYTLTPEELEDYERERSPMYRALFLKDIDAKRRMELERSPEIVAAREQEKIAKEKQEEERHLQRKRELEELKKREIEDLNKKELEDSKTPREKYDYIIKVCGTIVQNLQNTPAESVLASLGIKRKDDKWNLKTHLGNFVIDPYDGLIGSPEKDRDYEFIQHALGLLVLEWREFAGIETRHMNKELKKNLEKTLEKIGATKIGKIGEKYIFDGIYHNTLDDNVKVGGEVTILIPGWEMKTDRGRLVLIKAMVEAA